MWNSPRCQEHHSRPPPPFWQCDSLVWTFVFRPVPPVTCLTLPCPRQPTGLRKVLGGHPLKPLPGQSSCPESKACLSGLGLHILPWNLLTPRNKLFISLWPYLFLRRFLWQSLDRSNVHCGGLCTEIRGRRPGEDRGKPQHDSRISFHAVSTTNAGKYSNKGNKRSLGCLHCLEVAERVCFPWSWLVSRDPGPLDILSAGPIKRDPGLLALFVFVFCIFSLQHTWSVPVSFSLGRADYSELTLSKECNSNPDPGACRPSCPTPWQGKGAKITNIFEKDISKNPYPGRK